ncbi:molybdopterin-dependent oxidoreductase [Minwuia sp.]|uniref:nitrate reductase n=1 Tax=Minwuia sp. TaxID=2493630 RepID=UPI003A8F70BC
MADAGSFPAVRTTCPYCGVGCGVLARQRPDGSVGIEGDPDHPANFGKLCSKGAALAETLDLDGRLLHPEIMGQRASWDAATELVAHTFRQTIEQHGPDSVAFYVSGQLLTEDYYVANKLMKGFIGSANIDTNSRLCMASSVAGHKRAFGSDTVPVSYQDLEQADLVVLSGSNLAWCHPVLFQRLLAARDARPELKIVVIDPRRTVTAEQADLHLPIRSGGDVALFNGLLFWLLDHGKADFDFITRHTNGAEAAIDAAGGQDLAEIASGTGLSETQLRCFYDLFAEHEKVVTVYSQGVNQAADGTDRVNAIINCHLLTGRIGREGAGPFSVTGQPNAMGGREVGGLANQLAAHMDIENPEHRSLVRDFWCSPTVAATPGLKAVDMFGAVADGRIKAIWIMATNPVVSMPDADVVRDALAACPFVVVSDVERHTDTTDLAHVLLPAAAWGEKDGTVTNSERRISRQRSFLPLPGETRPDWRIICNVAQAMGHGAGFDYADPHAIFDEHARLSDVANQGRRDFDIGGLSGLDQLDYDGLKPVRWPAPKSPESAAQIFSDGHFFTADGKSRFVALRVAAISKPCAGSFILSTGRIRDQWHTMTRTGRSARLSQHLAEPFVEIHPTDAWRLALRPADLVRLSRRGRQYLARVLITDAQQQGILFAPMHWTAQGSSAARVDVLVDDITDPVSGQPALKSTHVRASRLEADWFGFGISLSRPDLRQQVYWATARIETGFRFECASTGPLPITDSTEAFLGFEPDAACEVLNYSDHHRGIYRFALFRKDQLVGAFFCADTAVAVEREWLIGQLGQTITDPAQQHRILAGRPGDGNAGPGAMVCACNNVGAQTITEAISVGANTVRCVGERTGAGTGCGSCQGEIGRMLRHSRKSETV